MSLKRIWLVVRKDLLLGPRKPLFLFAVVMPVGLTLILQVTFGSLFEPKPRLGIVDAGRSGITAAVQQMEGIELTLLDNGEELKTQVERNDLDAGLVLPTGFDEEVRRGVQPKLEFYLGGESLASNRIMLSVLVIDLIRGLEGGDAPVEVETVKFGEPGLPISIRLVPLLVFYALTMAGIFAPGSSLVEEKERGTLTAVLVTPARMNEVLAAKGLLGFFFAALIATGTLLLNRAFGPRPLDVLAVIAVAAALTAMIGLLMGIYARTSTALFALTKGSGVLLFAPVIFYIFPDWPQWIARLFPLYWIIEPIWRVSVMSEPLRTVSFELTVAVAITAALIPAAAVLSRRREV